MARVEALTESEKGLGVKWTASDADSLVSSSCISVVFVAFSGCWVLRQRLLVL